MRKTWLTNQEGTDTIEVQSYKRYRVVRSGMHGCIIEAVGRGNESSVPLVEYGDYEFGKEVYRDFVVTLNAHEADGWTWPKEPDRPEGEANELPDVSAVGEACPW